MKKLAQLCGTGSAGTSSLQHYILVCVPKSQSFYANEMLKAPGNQTLPKQQPQK